MSKSIIIQEGGTGKQMIVNKLKTDKVGGGAVLWIPEDETSLGTKSISSNGTYKASDDGKYGFSQVTVNVSGSSGSANPDGTPSIGGGSTPGSGEGVPAGGPGSCVIGTNPTTGNEQAVGVDSNGNLITTPIPSSIEIVRNPDNTSYSNGSPIDLTGATVIAKNADGSLWTSEDYPNGEIPISELTLKTPTADINKTSGPTAGGFQILDISPSHRYSTSDVYEMATADRTTGAGSITLHGIQITIPSGNGVIITATNPSNGRYIKHNSAFYYGDGTPEIAFFASDNGGTYGLGFVSILKNKTGTYGDLGSLSYLLGEVQVNNGGAQPVPIEWIRPADKKSLETSFSISVDGSGYSDDGGGSESGGGTNL